MMLISHIIIALLSLGTTTAMALWPTPRKLKLSMLLIALTLATGTYLVLSLHAPLLRTCVTGLVYLGVAVGGLLVGMRRLATDQIER